MRPRLVVALLLGCLAVPAPGSAATRKLGPLSCDLDSTCSGTITVPLDRSGVVPGSVKLYVEAHLPDGAPRGAFFHIAGGPGQASTDFYDVVSGGTPEAVAFADYVMITYDDRGTGSSEPIDCSVDDADIATEVEQCGAQLGSDRAFYSTRDNAADMDAIRAALGFAKVGLWGVSYGSRQALAYAQAYPTHVAALLLDSQSLPAGPDLYDAGIARAIPLALQHYCAGGRCALATRDPVGDVAAFANALAAAPLQQRVRIHRAPGQLVSLDAREFIGLEIGTDLNTFLTPALPALTRAAAEGRPQALLQLLGILDRAPVSSGGVSSTVLYTTNCDDAAVPWAADTPAAQRSDLLDAALAGLGTDAFAPFGPWIGHLGAADYCSKWQSPGRGIPDGPYPDVPVLALEGDLDIRTPVANAAAVVARFPQGHLLVVHGVGHSVMGTSLSLCPIDAVTEWLAGHVPPTSCTGGEPATALPYVPSSLAGATPLAPGGKVGRTLAAVRATLSLTGYLTSLGDYFNGDSRLAGLSAGWATAHTFNGFSDVRGVILDTVPRTDGAQIRVRGTAAAHGTLTVDGSGRIGGVLGGRRVRTRLP